MTKDCLTLLLMNSCVHWQSIHNLRVNCQWLLCPAVNDACKSILTVSHQWVCVFAAWQSSLLIDSLWILHANHWTVVSRITGLRAWAILQMPGLVSLHCAYWVFCACCQAVTREPADTHEWRRRQLLRRHASTQCHQVWLCEMWLCPWSILSESGQGGQARHLPAVSIKRTIWTQHGTGACPYLALQQ